MKTAFCLVAVSALLMVACEDADKSEAEPSSSSKADSSKKKSDKKSNKKSDKKSNKADAPDDAASAAPSADAEDAPSGTQVAGFFQGEPDNDIATWKGWVNTQYDYGFRIPAGWTSAALPGGGFMMHDKEQKALIALTYDSFSELTLASLAKKAKMAPFQATELTEVEPPTFVDVGSKKFLAKAALAKGQLNKSPGQIFWMDLAGIQTHEGETDNYHFMVMVGLKDGVSDEAKKEAMSAIRAMTPMSGRPYWKR